MPLKKRFIAPRTTTITSRTSTITHTFASAMLPVISPTENDINKILKSLHQNDNESLTCVYCGNPVTEWDHLNPMVRDKKATGYFTEINNLVPCCGICNQSKGNKDWKDWIVSTAQKAPLQRLRKGQTPQDIERNKDILIGHERNFPAKRIDT